MLSTLRRLIAGQEILDGYDDPELIEVIFRKTKAYDPQGDWPDMANVSAVLDFGGGCGQHYKLARRRSPLIRWAVVESPSMVRRATELSTERLQFFSDIESAAEWLGQVEVMHSDGALQYTSDPNETLSQLCALRAQRMLWYRLSLSRFSIKRQVQYSRLGDNGPGSLSIANEKTVRFVRTKIAEKTFLTAHARFVLEQRGRDWFHFSLTA